MTTKKARKTKEQRSHDQNPRKSLKLTRAEAEVMFLIWKSGGALSSKSIAERGGKWFGNETWNAAKVRGHIHDIRRLEKATGRKYLEAGGDRGEYKIDIANFVDLQWTAIIFLELSKGFKHLERQIPCEEFENYVFDKYAWDRSLIAGRIEFARRSRYIDFYQLETGSKYIKVEDRLTHDIEYLKLIVEDYYLEQRQENPTSPLTKGLAELIALYRSTKTPAKAKRRIR